MGLRMQKNTNAINRYSIQLPFLLLALLWAVSSGVTVETGQYEVTELNFSGPQQSSTDKPAEDISFYTEWQHESGTPKYKIYGFWDGDGKGGTSGNVFKIRFTPTKIGKWTLVKTSSSNSQLNGAQEGTEVNCVKSSQHGFWEREGIWFKRSDGSHQYMVGNVHYCMITSNTALEDVSKNKPYYNKIRFFLALHPQCPSPIKPFFSSSGSGSNAGTDAVRPNPAYFKKADDIIRSAAKDDMIIDLYMEGQQSAIRKDAYLRYCVARFASFPNVWMQTGVEWDEYMSASDTKKIGEKVQSYLPYSTPLSTISTHNWSSSLNGPWTHANIQGKVFGMKNSTDAIISTHKTANNIVANNDDNGPNFQGFGGTTREMETERILGCFLGAGYSGTGYKTSSKNGQYWTGGFDANKHSCSSDLKFLRESVDRYIQFWKMQPGEGSFSNNSDFVHMGWKGNQYLLGSNKSRSGLSTQLPPGTWVVRQFDLMQHQMIVLSNGVSGSYTFSTPNSKAAMTLFTLKELDDKPNVTIARSNLVPRRVGYALPTINLDGNTGKIHFDGQSGIIQIKGCTINGRQMNTSRLPHNLTNSGAIREP